MTREQSCQAIYECSPSTLHKSTGFSPHHPSQQGLQLLQLPTPHVHLHQGLKAHLPQCTSPSCKHLSSPQVLHRDSSTEPDTPDRVINVTPDVTSLPYAVIRFQGPVHLFHKPASRGPFCLIAQLSWSLFLAL